jgi:RimJ/RimL family protein N-acetyltransferase
MELAPPRGRALRFRYAREADAEFILSLRLDPAMSRFLSATDPSVAQQRDWLRGYQARESRGEEHYFIISQKDGADIGTVRIYDFRDGSVSWGSWMLRTPNPFCALESALLVYDFIFHSLRVAQVHFDVRLENLKVISFHRKTGAREVSADAQNRYFTYDLDSYVGFRKRYSFLVDP